MKFKIENISNDTVRVDEFIVISKSIYFELKKDILEKLYSKYYFSFSNDIKTSQGFCPPKTRPSYIAK